MSTPKSAEPTTPATPEVAPVAPVTPEPKPADPATEVPEPDNAKDAEFWKGKARAMEADAKKAARRLAELEDAEHKRAEAEMTELQKAQKRLADLEAENKNAKLALMRRDIAAKVSLPDVLIDRLRGETPEELEADALALLKDLPAPATAAQPKKPTINPTLPGDAQPPQPTIAEQRARIYGSGGDVLDPRYAEEHGGGVVHIDKSG